jgi:hypothetical protein
MDQRQQQAMDRKMSRYIDIAVIVAALLIIAMVAVAKGTEPIVFCEAPEVQSRQGYPIRSTWWTVGGRYPDRQTMISHLSQMGFAMVAKSYTRRVAQPAFRRS